MVIEAQQVFVRGMPLRKDQTRGSAVKPKSPRVAQNAVGGWHCGTAQCHQVAVLQSAAQGPPPGDYRRLTIPRAIGDCILGVEGHPDTEGLVASARRPYSPGSVPLCTTGSTSQPRFFWQPHLNFPTQQCRQVF